MKEEKLSGELAICLEYVFATPPLQTQELDACDDWLSCVVALPKLDRVVAAAYDGRLLSFSTAGEGEVKLSEIRVHDRAVQCMALLDEEEGKVLLLRHRIVTYTVYVV